MKNYLILSFGALFLFACNEMGDSFSENSDAGVMKEAINGAVNSPTSIDIDINEAQKAVKDDPIKIEDRKMIWTANLKFLVADVDESTKEIQNTCNEYGGFISNMDLSSTSTQLMNRIEIRVANDKFEKLISAFKKEAKFVEEFNIHSEDVTEEFVDIESRLKTKKEVRDRYIDVLRTKAGTVEDIIEAEEAIRVITEEIEAKEGRLRYLKDRVGYSTITLLIYQKVTYKERPEIFEKSYGSKFKDGLSGGWSFITTLVLALAYMWPLIIVLLLVLWKGKWMWKKLAGKT